MPQDSFHEGRSNIQPCQNQTAMTNDIHPAAQQQHQLPTQTSRAIF